MATKGTKRKEKLSIKELKEKTSESKEKTKELSILEGSAWAVMIGAGARFITPYAVALGLSNFIIGLISAFSTIASSLGQYVGAWWLQFAKNRREVLFKSAIVQAVVWIPIAFLFLLSPDLSGPTLVVLYSLAAFFGSLASPAWTSIIADSVEKHERGEFFGRRNKILGIVNLVASLAAGYLLKVVTNNAFIGFVTLFITAFIFRAISAYLLVNYRDPSFKEKREPLLKIFQIPADKHFRNFLLLSSGMVFATYIAAPFFAVYMLKDLKFDYLSFSMVQVAPIFTAIFTQPYWGKVIDKYGTRPVLFATSILIIFVPLLWIFAKDFVFALLIELYSGVVWAGFDLSVFNFLFRVAPRSKIPQYAAHANGISDLSAFVGASVGSFIVLYTNGSTIFFLVGLQIVFFISGILRLLAVSYALPKLSTHMKVDGQKFLVRVVTIYPLKGMRMELASIYETAMGFFGNGHNGRHRVRYKKQHAI